MSTKDAEPIEVLYLPSYNPELNLDERLNACLKYAIGSKVAPRKNTNLRVHHAKPVKAWLT